MFDKQSPVMSYVLFRSGENWDSFGPAHELTSYQTENHCPWIANALFFMSPWLPTTNSDQCLHPLNIHRIITYQHDVPCCSYSVLMTSGRTIIIDKLLCKLSRQRLCHTWFFGCYADLLIYALLPYNPHKVTMCTSLCVC